MNSKLAGLLDFTCDQIMAVETACHEHPWSANTMLSCLHGRYFNVALSEGERLVGFFIVERAGPDFTLMDICIHPDFQGQGLAKQLMAELVAQAKQQQAEHIFLEVRASNHTAIGLYKSVGFVETGVRKNYYPKGAEREDAILMMLANITPAG